MIRVGTNIYGNFQMKDISNNVMSGSSPKVRALIAGPCGHGKTCFINNACNTKYKVGITKGSLTRDIVFEDFAYLPVGKFRIYDTPGTNSSIDTLEHALVLRASLTNLKLNLILIQAKFQARFQQTIAHFAKVMKIFKGYESLVVFMVSHWDIMDKQPNKQQVLSVFGSTLKEYGLNNTKVIIYSNINSNFIQLSNILYKIGQRSQPKKIVIDDNTFYKYFNISNSITGLKTKQIEQYVDQIRDVADECIEFGESIKKQNQVDIDEVLSQLKIYMKYKLKLIQYQQYERYSVAFTDEKTTNVYLMISQFIQCKLEQLDQSSYLKMNKFFYEDNYKKSSDIRDLFRACPNCGLIWMKVMGCDGTTTCGNKPDFYDYFKNKDLHTYQFISENGKLRYIKKKQKNISQNIPNQKTKEQKFFKYKLSTNDKGIGCGKTFSWGQTKRIPNIEEILKEFYKVSNFKEIDLDVFKIKNQKKQYAERLDQKIGKTLQVIQKDDGFKEENSLQASKAIRKNTPLDLLPKPLNRQNSMNFLINSNSQGLLYPPKYYNQYQQKVLNNKKKEIFSYANIKIPKS